LRTSKTAARIWLVAAVVGTVCAFVLFLFWIDAWELAGGIG